MWHEGIAKKLSRPQRDVLIGHIDRPQRLDRHDASTTSLLEKRLLRPSHENAAHHSCERPKFTALTDDGRAVLGWVLANMIEQLVVAGIIDLERNGLLTRLDYRRGIEGKMLHDLLKPESYRVRRAREAASVDA